MGAAGIPARANATGGNVAPPAGENIAVPPVGNVAAPRVGDGAVANPAAGNVAVPVAGGIDVDPLGTGGAVTPARNPGAPLPVNHGLQATIKPGCHCCWKRWKPYTLPRWYLYKEPRPS